MTQAVLDASAILAVLFAEPGAELAHAWLPNGLVSAVNVAEVGAKLLDLGAKEAEFRASIEALGLHVVPFDEEAAHAFALLRPSTRRNGLSLGDRACLALAKASRLPAVTADRAWRNVDIGVEVRMLRGRDDKEE